MKGEKNYVDYGDDDSALDDIFKKGCHTCLYVLILFMNKDALGKNMSSYINTISVLID